MSVLKVPKLYPKQIEFCKSTRTYTLYGGARGGGKSYVARIKAVLLALNYPGIQILLLRRKHTELYENHVIPLMKFLNSKSKNPAERVANYKTQEKVFEFPNGSRIKLGYCDNEQDVLQYQGQAYEVIFLEECTHFTEFQYQSLTESNRLSGLCKEAFNPRMYLTGNPGGVGHNWVKRLFIDKEYRPGENPDNYVFIPALVYENEYIMENDTEYVKKLEALPEDRKKAMLYGDWDVFDGQFFSEFERLVHVVNPFQLDRRWKKYVSIDYGLDMFAVCFHSIAPDGTDYIYNEINKPDLIVSEAAQLLKKYARADTYFAPPDLWSRNRDTGKSTAQIFKENGVKLVKSSNNREHGWFAVKEYMKVLKKRNIQTGEEYRTSKLQIFSTCTNLIKCVSTLQYDDKKANDAATQPHEITHLPDALRYFCVMNSRSPVIKQNREQVFNFNDESNDRGYDYGEEATVI